VWGGGEFLTEEFLFMILKTVLNNGRSAENIVKNLREITLKNCKLLIFAAVEIHLETYLPDLVYKKKKIAVTRFLVSYAVDTGHTAVNFTTDAFIKLRS
jgi:hypothetical protein